MCVLHNHRCSQHHACMTGIKHTTCCKIETHCLRTSALSCDAVPRDERRVMRRVKLAMMEGRLLLAWDTPALWRPLALALAPRPPASDALSRLRSRLRPLRWLPPLLAFLLLVLLLLLARRDAASCSSSCNASLPGLLFLFRLPRTVLARSRDMTPPLCSRRPLSCSGARAGEAGEREARTCPWW